MRNRFVRPLLLTLTLLTVSAGVAAQTPHHGHSHAHPAVRENVSPEVREEVLQAIERWKQAVINADRAGLERAYHDDLTYGHTDGEVLGKAEKIGRNLAPRTCATLPSTFRTSPCGCMATSRSSPRGTRSMCRAADR